MDKKTIINITPWTDETRIPDWLDKLLEITDIPLELKEDLLAAKGEVAELGAVNYPTKARIEFWLHQHHEYIANLANTLNNQ